VWIPATSVKGKRMRMARWSDRRMRVSEGSEGESACAVERRNCARAGHGGKGAAGQADRQRERASHALRRRLLLRVREEREEKAGAAHKHKAGKSWALERTAERGGRGGGGGGQHGRDRDGKFKDPLLGMPTTIYFHHSISSPVSPYFSKPFLC